MNFDKRALAVAFTCFIGILWMGLAKSDRDARAIKAIPIIEETETARVEETSPTILERIAEYEANRPTPTLEVVILTVEPTVEMANTVEQETIVETVPILAETPMDARTTTEPQTEPLVLPSVSTKACISLTAEEENLLVRVASLEAGNQGWQGMALVMNVILNRRQAWGKSITELVYDKGQFSVVGCDKWNNGFTVPESLTALAAVKNGWDGSQGALFFCAPSGRSQWIATTRQYLFTAWGHEFYR